MIVILGLLGVALLGSMFLTTDGDEPDQVEDELEADTSENSGFEENGTNLFLDGQEGEFAAQTDTLTGGDGEDYLRGGVGDIMFGGAGNDSFEAPLVGPAYIQDFDDGELIIIPYSGNVPEIEFSAMDHGTMIFADGAPIVEVRGTYDFQDAIQLIPRDDDV